ncbi:MAG: thioredoxin [Anaerolineales bacterium]
MEMEKMNEPINVTDDAFEKAVLKSEVPVLVDFWAPWCGPCKMVEPILNKFASEYAGKLLVTRVNTDENSKWATEYGIQGIPTILFISGGKILHRQVGAVPEIYLREIVDTMLNTVEEDSES